MIILATLFRDAASRFDNGPQFIDKGFKMVTILRDAQAPTGELALMNNFCSLTDLAMGYGEALKTYMSRIRTTINLLCGGNVQLHPILINLFALRGLNSAYKSVKHDLALHSKNFKSPTLDELEKKCVTFTNADRNV